jgi:glycerol-3-phosphate acyltransferase PlsX
LAQISPAVVEKKDQRRVIRISLDLMGGDFGPEVVIPGAAKALERHPGMTFLMYGLKEQCEPVLDKYPKLKAKSVFHDCDVAVGMDEKPSQALRRGRYVSSMWRSIEAVKTGDADVIVSAGNTGALMAMSKFCLRTMANIERPAIAAIWPTLRGESIVLDVGATIGADSQQLLDFALMGGAMARALFEIDRPTVGLLNVGVEEMKGQEDVKDAGRLIREADLESLEYGKDRLYLCQGCLRHAARKARSEQSQRRSFSRPQRHCHQEPRGRQCRSLRSRHRCRLRHG